VTQYNLPDANVILYDNFFSSKESDKLYTALINKIQWQQDEIKMFGKTIDLPRLTAWYGDPGCAYTYSGITMQPQAWNNDLLFIKDKIETVEDETPPSRLTEN